MLTDSIPEGHRWFARLENAAPFSDAELAACLEELATRPAVSMPVVSGPVLGELALAAGDLPFRPAAYEAGKPEARVYQEFGHCDSVPAAHPVSLLGAWLEAHLQRALATFTRPPVAPDFTINDIVCLRYQPGDLGITPHRDHVCYTGLIILVVLCGAGRYFVCKDRQGRSRQEIPSEPGRAILMPGPDFAGRSHRPFHLVEDISELRLSVGLRHDARKPRTAPPE